METTGPSGTDRMAIDEPDHHHGNPMNSQRVASDAMDIDAPGYHLRNHTDVGNSKETVAEHTSDSSTEESPEESMEDYVEGDECGDGDYISDGSEGEFDDEDYDEENDENRDVGMTEDGEHLNESTLQNANKPPMLGNWTPMPPQQPPQNHPQSPSATEAPAQTPAQAPTPFTEASVSTTGISQPLPTILITADGTSTALPSDLAKAELQKATQGAKYGMLVYSAIEIKSILINFRKSR
ncbi:hypothetical protein F5B19DRAFT_472593 [Rostrohypoxylon terebratum]|nr:hypothetical protein F5B19DRAFT_472593 [Rostrohypoxylon terebratum]